MVFGLSENVILALLVGSLIWLSVVSFFLFQTIRHYRRVTEGIHRATLKDVLEKMLSRQQKTEVLFKNIVKKVDILERDGKLHIQKVGVVRFNPFADTGGEQSFILALLDNENTGLVLSSLFSRSGMRWYAKTVVKGKGVKYRLSEEERKAIKKAEKK